MHRCTPSLHIVSRVGRRVQIPNSPPHKDVGIDTILAFLFCTRWSSEALVSRASRLPFCFLPFAECEKKTRLLRKWLHYELHSANGNLVGVHRGCTRQTGAKIILDTAMISIYCIICIKLFEAKCRSGQRNEFSFSVFHIQRVPVS